MPKNLKPKDKIRYAICKKGAVGCILVLETREEAEKLMTGKYKDLCEIREVIG